MLEAICPGTLEFSFSSSFHILRFIYSSKIQSCVKRIIYSLSSVFMLEHFIILVAIQELGVTK